MNRRSWPGATLTRYRQDVIAGKESDYPPEFLKAVEQYADTKFLFRSELWEGLQKWREHVERNPESAPWYRMIDWSSEDRETGEYFQNLILHAVFFGHQEVLQPLLETAMQHAAPEPDMHGVRAAIQAFSELFEGGDEHDRPTKGEVRDAAAEILTNAGLPIPGRREWPRIFKKAGLSNLRAAPRRSKSNRV
jgi:hypothetical protein